MYRLYVDEVGTDDLTHLETDDQRYLSLTGVAMKITSARDDLEPKLNWIKSSVFGHDPDAPLVFHRRKIAQKKQEFGALNDPAKHALFDKAIMRVFKSCDYAVITAFIDKQAMLRKKNWRIAHPYHYLMDILVDKYTRYLERMGSIGDIMPEGRKGKKDTLLQTAYEEVRANGLFYVSAQQIAERIPSKALKFRYKPNNVAGLQLADLLAHPSHMTIRERLGHPVELGTFAKKVRDVLIRHKYDRSATDKIVGYGMKWLP